MAKERITEVPHGGGNTVASIDGICCAAEPALWATRSYVLLDNWDTLSRELG